MNYTLHMGDCLDYLRTLPDGSVDAVITDPPYGIGWQPKGRTPIRLQTKLNKSSLSFAGRHFNMIHGDDKPFDPTPFLLGKVQVIWGAHVFYPRLPETGGLLVWDKSCGSFDEVDFGQCEIAWRSNGGAVRIFRNKWMGLVRAGREKHRDGPFNRESFHPNEKPVALMRWCLDMAKVPQGATVLDPFMGSGTTGVACMQTGRNFIGCEIDPGYFAIAKKRIEDAAAQLPLIPHETEPQPEQGDLWP